MAFATIYHLNGAEQQQGNDGPPLISSSTPVEMMRLAGTMQPVNVLTIPQGTYTGAGTHDGIHVGYIYRSDISDNGAGRRSGPITTNLSF